MINLGHSVVKQWYRLWVMTGRHPRAESKLNTALSELESWEEFKSGQDNSP